MRANATNTNPDRMRITDRYRSVNLRTIGVDRSVETTPWPKTEFKKNAIITNTCRFIDITARGSVVTNIEPKKRTDLAFLPGVTVIERLCADALVAAERRIEGRIVARLNDQTKERLNALLTEIVDGKVSQFVWLRQFEVGSNSPGASRLLDKLEFLQALGLSPDILDGIPPHRVTRLRRHQPGARQGDRRAVGIADGAVLGQRLHCIQRRAILLRCATGRGDELDQCQVRIRAGTESLHPRLRPIWAIRDPEHPGDRERSSVHSGRATAERSRTEDQRTIRGHGRPAHWPFFY